MTLFSTSLIVGMFIPYARIFSNCMAKMNHGNEMHIIKKINTRKFHKIKTITHNKYIGMVLAINKFSSRYIHTMRKDVVEFCNQKWVMETQNPSTLCKEYIFNLQIFYMIINIDIELSNISSLYIYNLYVIIMTSHASHFWMNKFWSDKILMIWVIQIIKEVIYYALDDVKVKELVLMKNRDCTFEWKWKYIGLSMIKWYLHSWMKGKKYVLLPKSI